MTTFSDFIRNATDEEKEDVYMDVIDKAIECQNCKARILKLEAALKELNRYFTSSNDVPVEFARIRTKDYERITEGLFD